MAEHAIKIPDELPARLMLCLHPECYGAWYFPLALSEMIVCPADRSHDVVVYSAPVVCQADVECTGDHACKAPVHIEGCFATETAG